MESEIAKYYFKPKSFWEDIPKSVCDKLKKHSTISTVKRDEIIYTEGTCPKGLYILNKGIAKLYTLDNLGQEQIIYILGKHEMFGYRSIACNNNSVIYITAIENCEIELIDRYAFENELYSSVELNKVFMHYFGEEFRILYHKLSALALKPAIERLALALLVLSQKFSLDKGSTNVINFLIRDIANYSGIGVETTSRQLLKLKEMRAIEMKGRKIIIKDRDTLFGIANIG